MPVTIGRRELIAALGGAAAGWPLVARTQQRLPVVRFLNGSLPRTNADLLAVFRQDLNEGAKSATRSSFPNSTSSRIKTRPYAKKLQRPTSARINATRPMSVGGARCSRLRSSISAARRSVSPCSAAACRSRSTASLRAISMSASRSNFLT